jgi:hypothetical protein
MKTLRERELATGDIVEFQVPNSHRTTEQRFRIQHRTGFIELTFDEVRQFFIKKECSDIFCCTIKVDYQIFQIFKLTYEQFTNLVAGKKFRIYVDNEMYSFKDISETQPLDRFKYKVQDLSLIGDVTESPEMVKSTCYQFEEATTLNL